MAESGQAETHPGSHWQRALAILPKNLEQRLLELDSGLLEGLEELRIRTNQPLELCGRHGSLFVHRIRGTTTLAEEGFIIRQHQIQEMVQTATQFSMYAMEEELRRGYITVPGGHRLGLAGRIVLDDQGRVKSMRTISSLNVRVARAFPGVANPLRSFLHQRPDGKPLSALLLSGPGCGKTTMLRDVARQWSDNLLIRRKVPAKVVIVDERSEIAGCVDGIPQFAVGVRTDVLDGCPKAQGMLMAIRSLSPDIVITDEIGRADDVNAVMEATHSGVCVIASAHAANLDEWRQRPHMDSLFQARAFSRYVLLSRRRSPGTVEAILDEAGRPIS